MLFWLVLAAFVVWQLLLVAWSFNQASNAARTASRVDGRGGDAVKAGRAALSPGLRDGARIEMKGERATASRAGCSHGCPASEARRASSSRACCRCCS